MGFLFEELDVYKRAVGLAERVTKLTGDFSSGTYAISDQLKRAALSISCNIAEGNGRWHAKEKIRFFTIARGSAFECVPLLEVSRGLGLVEEETHEELKAELDEICAMIMGLVRREKRKQAEDSDQEKEALDENRQ